MRGGMREIRVADTKGHGESNLQDAKIPRSTDARIKRRQDKMSKDVSLARRILINLSGFTLWFATHRRDDTHAMDDNDMCEVASKHIFENKA